MKKYIGTKTIMAEPMTLGEAVRQNLIRASEANNNPGYIAGYHVRYKDGYESWSPKDVFDEAYKPADTYIDRMIIEHDQLVKKTKDAEAFTKTEKYSKLPKLERETLEAQISVMKSYIFLLYNRIELAIEREKQEQTQTSED